MGVKGNQVRVLDDPVTVSGKKGCVCHCAKRHEKVRLDNDPQVRKPAENDWWMASEEGLMNLSLRALFVVMMIGSLYVCFYCGSRRFLFMCEILDQWRYI